MTVLLSSEHRWECPNCDLTDVTYEQRPHSRMHDCRGLVGLSVPMVPAGTKCKIEAHERGDYLGDDEGWVRLNGEGRPIMNAITTRDEGEDCTVYAPTAHAEVGDFR